MISHTGIAVLGVFNNLHLAIIAVVFVGIVSTIIFYRYVRTHNMAKLKSIQEDQEHENGEMKEKPGIVDDFFEASNFDDNEEGGKTETGIPGEEGGASEKPDGLSYLWEDSGGISQSYKTNATVEEKVEPVVIRKEDYNKEFVAEGIEASDTGIEREIITKLEYIEEEINNIKNEITTKYEQVLTKKSENEREIIDKLNKVNNAIDTKAQDITNIVNDFEERVKTALDTRVQNIINTFSDFDNRINGTLNKVLLNQKQKGLISSILKKLI